MAPCGDCTTEITALLAWNLPPAVPPRLTRSWFCGPSRVHSDLASPHFAALVGGAYHRRVSLAAKCFLKLWQIR